MIKNLILAGSVLSVSAAGLFGASNAAMALTRDCSTNAIARCGVHTVAELQQKYSANQPGDLTAIYEHYGISRADIVSGRVQEGLTYKDGRVVVNGQTVATNAASLGRVKKVGDYPVSIAGKTYWEATNQNAFRSGVLEVLVFTNNDGTFKAAVIKDCGNAVKATPVAKPVAPKPTPQPVTPQPAPAPAPTPAPAPVEAPKPAPVAETTPVQPVEQPAPETCAVSGKESLPKNSPECVEVAAPAPTPQVLPSTGASDVLSSVMGLSSLTAAGYYYVRSRRA